MNDLVNIGIVSETSKAKVVLEEREYYTAMSHFYRGELGRIMVWRQRLDTTSNWAILTSTGIITFALSHPEVTHLVFMIANIMLFLLLVIEGRRYRYYDAFRARVRMLEAHFLVPVIMRRQATLEGDWRQMLAEDMLLPSFKIGVRESISRRLRRNYIWIFVVLLTAWWLKIYIHPYQSVSWNEMWNRFVSQQPLHPMLFWVIVAGFYGMLIWLGFYSEKNRYASGEMERRGPTRQRWKL
jgi:uncharacterized membrane protein